MKYWLAVTVSVLIALAANVASGQGRDRDRDGKWEKLGCEQVGRKADRNEIRVGRREGRFSAIRLEANGNDVSILDLKIVYANGQPDDIRVRSEIREGEQTRPLDLKGRDRAIERIEFISKKDFQGRKGRGKAQVCIYGRSNEKRADKKWEDLGCQSVGFLSDRDVIRVGRREGRFKAIRLNVSGNAVYLLDLKVVYANGQPDDIKVRSEIREGGETRPLDLRGGDRAIDRVELAYRAKPNFKGKARVCLSGLQN
ncbi:MAG: hypothetical protein SGJ17_11845 [Hyphomicrobiales bacterium]|nr:hypothetical protein [Hyphomicrobiales bacterium]